MSSPAENILGRDEVRTIVVVVLALLLLLLLSLMVWIVSESSAHISSDRAFAGRRFILTRAILPLSSGGYSVVTHGGDGDDDGDDRIAGVVEKDDTNNPLFIMFDLASEIVDERFQQQFRR